jgi:hypothetical protein
MTRLLAQSVAVARALWESLIPINASPAAPGPAHRPFSWLGQGALYTLLWLSLIKVPDSASTNLDISWRMVLSFATDQKLQYGTDLVFTYGPLGYLLSYVYTGRLFAAYWTWQIVGNSIIAAGLWRFGTLFTPARRSLYYVYLFCIGSVFPDAMIMNLTLVLAVMLARKEFQRWYWLATVGGLFAVFSLMKFTNLFLCGFILIAAAGYFAWQRLGRELSILSGAFAFSFLGGWIGHGQSLRTLPAFVQRGMEVSLGYAGAMALDPSPLMFWLGLTAAVSVAGYLILYFFSSADRPGATYTVLVVSAVGFLNWKHGFIRADGHVLAHFMLVMMIVCAYPALTRDEGRFSTGKAVLLGASFATSVWGMVLFMPMSITLAPSQWNKRIREAAFTLSNFSTHRATLEAAWKTAAHTAERKFLTAYVGKERVTHLGDDQGYSLLNGLNFVPMPTIQSYSAYTPGLNRLDVDFLTSDRGPKFVIQRYRALLPRLAPLEDSFTQKLLYQTYYYVMEEGGLILWEKPASGEGVMPAPEKLLSEKTVAFDEAALVPDSGGLPIWAEVHVAPSLLGRLRQFLYKPPLLEFDVESGDGTKERYGYVQAMGDAGFILSPFLRNEKDLIAYQTQKRDYPVKKFSLHSAPGGEKYWKSNIRVVLRTVSPFQRASDGLSVATPSRFRMTSHAPVVLEALVPPTQIFLDGRYLLHMHAPSRMEFAVPAGFKTVSARFGLFPSAYTPPNATDGVEFSVTWLSPDGRSVELFRRFLNPVSVVPDQGIQNLRITTAQTTSGRLVFRVSTGPANNSAFDWAYWTDVEIK